jgi:hypothetical protein
LARLGRVIDLAESKVNVVWHIDSPGIAFERITTKSGAPMVEYSNEAKFRTYLLWKPLQGNRIPLGVVEWSYKVKAAAVGDGWELLEWDTNPPVRQKAPGSPTTDMPVLSPNILDVLRETWTRYEIKE